MDDKPSDKIVRGLWWAMIAVASPVIVTAVLITKGLEKLGVDTGKKGDDFEPTDFPSF